MKGFSTNYCKQLKKYVFRHFLWGLYYCELVEKMRRERIVRFTKAMVSVVVDAISYREQNTENKDLRLLFFTKKKRKEKI